MNVAFQSSSWPLTQRRSALANLASVTKRDGVLLFTAHDRRHVMDASQHLRAEFHEQLQREKRLAASGGSRRFAQSAGAARVVEVGDRYFEEEDVGRTCV